jgi:hypothetical protein
MFPPEKQQQILESLSEEDKVKLEKAILELEMPSNPEQQTSLPQYNVGYAEQ